MWTALRLRAPRIVGSRLGREPASKVTPVAADARLSIEPLEPDGLADTELALRPADLPAVRDTLAERLGRPVAVDSPARLAEAIGRLIASSGGRGDVEVRRWPGALRMPELWTVRLTRADRPARATLEALVR